MIQFISQEGFIKALLKICVVAYKQLGGQDKDQALKVLERDLELKKDAEAAKQYTVQKEKYRQKVTQEVLEELKQEFKIYQEKSTKILNRKEEQTAIPEQVTLARERHEREFQHFLKQQDG